jgi:hypothetical protein
LTPCHSDVDPRLGPQHLGLFSASVSVIGFHEAPPGGPTTPHPEERRPLRAGLGGSRRIYHFAWNVVAVQ